MATVKQPAGSNESEDDAWIGALLKAEASRYEPDHDRIRQRIRDGGERPAASRSASLRPVPSRPVSARTFRRPGWVLPAAAAGFVALIAGAITAVQQYDGSTTNRAVQVATQSTASPTGADPVTPITPTSPPKVGSAVSTAPHRPSPTRSQQAPPPPAKDDVALQVAASTPDQLIDMPKNVTDWIVAGTRADKETIRFQNGGQKIGGPHLTGNPTATSVAGPFAASWTSGQPDRSGTKVTNWLSVSGPAGGPETGLLLQVPATKRPATLVLYVGAKDATGELKAQFVGQKTVASSRLKSRTDGTGYVVTIQFQTGGPDDTLTVQLTSGFGGSIALAAAVLR